MTKGPLLIDDCFLHDKDRLRHDEALVLLRDRLACIVGTETIAASDAAERILAEPILAPHPIPLHRNAAVDGYAYNHGDSIDIALPVSNRIAAGSLNPPRLEAGTAARIFTGAPMPDGADTVAMQEDCTADGDTVVLPQGLKIGANCRQAGEDLQPGDLVVPAGQCLKPADLAALASIGRANLVVYKKLRLALFSSGDEMRDPGDHAAAHTLQPGEVYDANQPLIAALSRHLPVSIDRLGIIADDADAVQSALSDAAARYDVIITTGGASRGAEDHMVSTLDRLGKRHLWQLAVKPGRPMIFGQLDREANDGEIAHCLYFGLPGNPVAAMVCFLLYAQPALLKLAGANWSAPARYQIPARFDITKKKPDRREFLRGKLKLDSNGTTTVDKFSRDGSGLISSLRESDGFIEIEESVTSLKAGELVSFIPFTSFLP